MPIAKTASTLLAKLDDAPPAARGTREADVAVQIREPAPEVTTLDGSLEDPYDNIACTD